MARNRPLPTTTAERRSRYRPRAFAALLPAVALGGMIGTAQLSSVGAAPPTHMSHTSGPTMSDTDRSAAMLATAAYQDVAAAETAGYASTLNTLGCFQSADEGGMGVHYLNEGLLDDVVDIAEPEAMVYEMGADGEITGLVAHEYIVPVEAWHEESPPSLFGMDFHPHPTLPLYVLHTWLWKTNPNGMFADWNPAVRQCPAGVPIFGVDLPE